jgi:hypothetical protein
MLRELHRGFSTSDELKPLVGLGASTEDVERSPEATWGVLADPEGKGFCLLAKLGPGLHPLGLSRSVPAGWGTRRDHSRLRPPAHDLK